mmetsp:Transcript_7248/g.6530  ORF Transcript_7248/g.6530 Transcript_7248/m.6530 type:complete len:104 (+) Transcript_7248:1690-2001(+)|eukprot:CAMPEP_0114587380 /NCGR_PEP_ID=MMETSP0125-20121206/10346_1 /TAXON_ID=485358 ORGANISM="Aristerostoma sp., Strain ATCC 50986" /NCGR_SAMPLE_ID=MMETSP0125 /ASSEMBLY_ACC=CAM_ASM_000245 /LENGTH=103 /DNA_ID=CAMNT_0001783245 /DNA_START=1791 /DNA_END=2102 /DNA_ORIENTATION=-
MGYNNENYGSELLDNPQQSTSQLPYIATKQGGFGNTGHYEPFNANKSGYGWKNKINNPYSNGYDGYAEGNDIKHYNIIYNNNTFNYNISHSPNLWNSYSKKKI